MAIKKNKSNNLNVLLLISVLLQFGLLMFIKYSNQYLSLSELSFSNTGNLINLSVYLFAIVGLVILSQKKDYQTNSKTLTYYFILSALFLIGGYLSIIITLPFNSIYILGQFGNKIFTGLLFTSYQFFFFIFLILIYLSIRKNSKKIILKSYFLASLFMIIFLSLSLLHILSHEEKVRTLKFSKDKSYNIVVLGAAVWSGNTPSPILAARVDRAVDMIKNYKLKGLYLTGSNAPGELSEAEVAYRYLISKIQIADSVVIEKNTTSTNEQIQFIKKEIYTSGNDENIVVISDAFHLVRIEEISRFHNIKIKTVASDLELSFASAFYNKIREALALTVFWFFAL